MIVKILRFSFLSILFSLTVAFIAPDISHSQSSLLEQGIEQYKDENFEEAIEILTKAREQDPDSSSAAFFLGLAYKQTVDYDKAFENLKAAVTLKPRIKEALIELIDVSIQVGKFDEARQWLDVAESEAIFPAKTAFLKGMLLFKEEKYQEAVESFEKAKGLDESYTQSADYQIALCYVRQRKLTEAKSKFQAAIQRNPGSDLAAFAREYQDVVEDRIFMERPFRFKVGLLPFYDTNVVLSPGDITLAPGLLDKPTAGFNTTFNVDWVPAMEGPWLFNAQYALSSRIHENFGSTHDYLANTINLYPGYDFGKYALNLPVRYNLTWVRDPSYKRYVSTINIGPLFRTTLNSNHILEAFAGYNDDYYFRDPFIQEEDRSGNGLDAYLSWIWLFKTNAFFNLRFEYLQQNTDGSNWENDGYRGSINMVYPLTEKLRLQVAGEAYIQDYKNVHTIFLQERDDKTYTGILGLTWALDRHFSFIAQYNYIRADSNIAIYDYNRTIIVGGVEIRF